jgi:esterase
MTVLASFSLGGGPRSTVLLHGFLGSGKNLRTLAQRWSALAPERTLLMPDLRGHGESPPLTAGADLDALAADVLAAAASLPGPLTLVGHSLGGRVALAAARRAPDRLAQIVLLDIAPGPLDPSRADTRRVVDILLRAPARGADRREFRAFFLGQGLSAGLADWLLMNLEAEAEGGGFRWRIDRESLAALHDRSMYEDLWPVVEAGAVPLGCIRGGRSGYVSDADVRRLAAAGCAVETLGDAGHYVHVDALEALVQLLARY